MGWNVSDTPLECASFFQSLNALGLDVRYAVEVLDSGVTVPLHVAEQALIEHASAHRVKEFTLGRSVAKRAVAQYSGQKMADIAILKTPKGLPLWPDNTVGSISHSQNIAIAVCASQTHCKTLGVDIEKIRTVNPLLEKKILAHNESLNAWGGECNRALITLFSVKESIYKAVCSLAGQVVTVKNFSVIPLANNSFRCDVSELVNRPNTVIEGRYKAMCDAVISVAYSA